LVVDVNKPMLKDVLKVPPAGFGGYTAQVSTNGDPPHEPPPVNTPKKPAAFVITGQI
jgi:hypothetical protein